MRSSRQSCRPSDFWARPHLQSARNDSQISWLRSKDFASGIAPTSASVRPAATPRTVWPSAAKRSSIKRPVMPDKPLTTSAEFRFSVSELFLLSPRVLAPFHPSRERLVPFDFWGGPFWAAPSGRQRCKAKDDRHPTSNPRIGQCQESGG